ncbi:MAG: HAMP domain-containing sensor histidine kinase [Rhodocyclaceae bacterium]|nr:HAMP domain-containing sensor histidine kinase [Rhodocyclaceae bacterium]
MENITSPPRMFAIISLLMIAVMLTVTGFTQAPFFRQTIIDREAAIVRDLANALAIEHGVSASDLESYTVSSARLRLDQSFSSLKSLSDVYHIKVFNRNSIIAWSDDMNLLGTMRTSHVERLTRAMHGEVQAVFNPAVHSSNIFDRGPATPATVEFYVPLVHAMAGEPPAVMGVLSLYRAPDEMNKAIRHGLYLLWSVIGGAGLILFVALFKLFDMVYSRQKNAELQFSKLTAEHHRIVQIEKLSAMGELVGEIAHQLNNPLVGVINLAQLAEREAENPQRVRELLVDVKKAGSECRDIVQRILRINQISRSEPQATDMNELVRDTIAFCHQSLGYQHVVEFRPPGQEVMLNVDPVLVRHALFNLIHNAILAAPEGVVTVSLMSEQQEGVPGYKLSVTDSGGGFSEEAEAKLFKPFFTTRPQGTGLGLSVAQHIAMKHGGAIRAENLASGGARFSIWLPAITKL